MHRRAFLTASTAATVALALGLEETPVRGRLTLTDIDRAFGRSAALPRTSTPSEAEPCWRSPRSTSTSCAPPPTAARTGPGSSRP
ncbi:twin-arginine translocation signal domain-containing protein [Streptomyces sp. WAC00263]|uniref:twin-arginine translocation signal domain-containing protein n=1 Tax=Streptomyces sp. WAC00263 TaxID=1917422 RepID=UPI001F506BE3|nr:twin-arginine translocation signal domain-containing protein [Streptomyces sp. WAC00263]